MPGRRGSAARERESRAAADEFDVIERFFTTPPEPGDAVWLGVGDDAAVLDVPPGSVVVDEMICRPIPAHADGYAFGAGALDEVLARSRAGDARPRWITLSLTLPEADERWLEGFGRAIREGARRHRVSLVGGDTTQGPGAIALCVYSLRTEGEGSPPEDGKVRASPRGRAAAE